MEWRSAERPGYAISLEIVLSTVTGKQCKLSNSLNSRRVANISKAIFHHLVIVGTVLCWFFLYLYSFLNTRVKLS